jgi:hypothetical protein
VSTVADVVENQKPLIERRQMSLGEGGRGGQCVLISFNTLHHRKKKKTNRNTGWQRSNHFRYISHPPLLVCNFPAPCFSFAPPPISYHSIQTLSTCLNFATPPSVSVPVYFLSNSPPPKKAINACVCVLMCTPKAINACVCTRPARFHLARSKMSIVESRLLHGSVRF